MNRKIRYSHAPLVFSIVAAALFLTAATMVIRADTTNYYWKDAQGNGRWDWDGNQWYIDGGGSVGVPRSDGGAVLFFQGNGSTNTFINSGFSGGFFKLNSILLDAGSAGRNYFINAENGGSGIELYSKIETLIQNNVSSGSLTINCVTQLGTDSEINAVGNSITLGDLRMNGKILNSFGANSLNITGVISGTGTYNIKNQGITVTYSGSNANTFTGATTVESSSQLYLNKSANTAAIAGQLTINSGGTVRTDAANQLNNQLVTVNGTLNLNGNSQSTALAGSGVVNLDGAAASGVLTINNTGTDTFSGVITDNARTDGSLIKIGAGTQILTGTNTYDGGTLISGGTLVLGNATNTLSDTGLIDIVGGTLSLGNNSDTVGNVTLEAGGNITGTGGTLTVTTNGSYDMRSGSVTANLAGTGVTLTKSTSGGLSLTGTNTYTGGTTNNGGDITFSNSSAFGTGAIAFGPNGLDSMSLMSTAAVSLSNNITISDLSAVSGRTATLGSFSTASVGTNAYTGNITLNNTLNIKSSSPTSNPLTFSTGVISGTGGLIINPAGTLSPGAVNFTGNNTYTGTTTVNAGTLFVNNTAGSGTGTGLVNVNNSGTLGGTGSIAGSTTIHGGGNITGGTNGTVGTLTLQNNLTFSGTNSSSLATYVVDLTSTSSDKLVVGGTLDLSGLNDRITFQGTTGASSYTLATYNLGSELGIFDTVTNLPTGYVLVYGPTEIDLITAPVPEPSTWIASGLALSALLFTQRRRLRATPKA